MNNKNGRNGLIFKFKICGVRNKMDKLVRKIEVPLAKKAIEKAEWDGIKNSKYKTKFKKMEVNKMQNEKKEFIKKFNVAIEDLLDNYEKYTDEEKAQVKDIFQKVADLNKVLDKYDVETKFNWIEYWNTVGEYFVTVRYF